MRLGKVCNRIAVSKPRQICGPCHRAIKGPPRKTNRLVNRGWDASIERHAIYEQMGWRKGKPQADG